MSSNDLPNLAAWSFNTVEGRWQREGEIAEYNELTFSPSFLTPGDWTVSLPVDTDYLEILDTANLVTIDWRGYRSTWRIGAPNLHLTDDSETPTFVYEVGGVGALAMLKWAPALPDPAKAIITPDLSDQPVLAETDPAPYNGPAETVITQLVAGNLRDWYGLPIVVPASQGRGSVQPARPQMDDLLELVTNIAKVGGIGVDVGLEASSPTATRADLTLRIWVPEDKTRDVRLTAAAGTLEAWEQAETEPTLTKAIVMGAGTGGMDRVKLIVTTPDSEAAAKKWGGHRVQMVDGPSSFDPEELRAAGEAAILEGSATRTLSLTAAEAEGLMAFTHYQPGDKGVGEVIEGASVTDVIQSITVTVGNDEGVTVQPIFGNPAAADVQLDIAEQIGALKRRVRHLQRRK
jgi:hypothetical protein